MKCENCQHINTSDSLFCEECGKEFNSDGSKNKASVRKNTPLVQELESIIFVPKKRHLKRTIIIITALVIIAVTGLLVYFYYLGNSEKDKSKTDNAQDSKPPDYTKCIKIVDDHLFGATLTQPNPIYKATIYNGCDLDLKYVYVRINFFKYSASKSADMIPADTKYIEISPFLGTKDSDYEIQAVYTNFDTSKPFNWQSEIYNAEKK